MTVGGRRKLRIFFKFGLLVSLPVTGYLWALSGASPLTIAMTAVCAVMALGAEGLASSTESRLQQLRGIAATEEQNFAAEANSRDEKIRQMDRIVETLSNQNHDLRGKLVSLHGEAHRLMEETAFIEGHAEPTPAQPAADAPPSEDGGGEVTDINSLRNRR